MCEVSFFMNFLDLTFDDPMNFLVLMFDEPMK